VCHAGLSGEVGLASHGSLFPAKNLKFCVGFVATVPLG
jgi:hypothetical protein